MLIIGLDALSSPLALWLKVWSFCCDAVLKPEWQDTLLASVSDMDGQGASLSPACLKMTIDIYRISTFVEPFLQSED